MQTGGGGGGSGEEGSETLSGDYNLDEGLACDVEVQASLWLEPRGLRPVLVHGGPGL